MKSTYALIAGAILMPVSAAAQTPAPRLDGTRLDLVVRGEVTRVPDVALISAGVVTQGASAQSALAENAARMARVLAALRRAGVAEADIATAQVALAPQYRYADNQPPVVTGYQATNTINVRFRDIARSGTILETLVREGANTINGPTLEIDKPDAALDEARAAAVRTARTRAELYARAAGLSVRRIVALREGDDAAAPGTIPAMMRSSEAASKTEIIPGDAKIGVTLTVTFELQ